jgi:5-methylcytosine-specific restriction endonuclease McrA
MKKSRYPSLKKVDGKYVCRGCGGEVPQGRQTWCSRECYKTHCPQMVNWAVRQRDKGICQICQLPAKRPEYDHIIPFSKGGNTILENMRTLCTPCHKAVTKAFAAQGRLSGSRKKRISNSR